MTAELQLLCAVAFAFGLLFGSFLNVCIYRMPLGKSVVIPRSLCPACGHSIAAYDNIPLLSYVLLRGRCRACHQSIGWRYPVVELSSGVLLATIAWRYGLSLAALKWALFELLMVALFWMDLEERLLPDELTLGGSLAGLLLAVFVPVPGVLSYALPVSNNALVSLCNAVLAGCVFAGLLWATGALYKRALLAAGAICGMLKFRKSAERMRQRADREFLGLGDVKLMLLFGIFLGLQNCLYALLIGSVAGSVISVIYLVAARKNPSTYGLPYGTFLCVGAAIVPLMLNA